jgi:hypothetical protein
VHTLFNPPTNTPAPTTTASPPPAIKGGGSTVDVRNAGAPDGMAGKLSTALTAVGFAKGEATTIAKQPTTQIFYGSGAKDDATKLAALLGNVTVTASSAASARHVAVYLGKDFTWPSALAGGPSSPSTSSSVAIPTEGPQGGAVAGGGIPCVD